MFRSAFHTGYVPPHVMRLTKQQLDGACSAHPARYPDDFFLDLIFEPVDAEKASQLLEEQQQQLKQRQKEIKSAKSGDEDENKAPTTKVKASEDDTMLHRDSRFWDVIAKRQEEQAACLSKAWQQKLTSTQFGPRSVCLVLWMPEW